MTDNLGNQLRRNVASAEAARQQAAAKGQSTEDRLRAQRIIKALPHLLERASSSGKSFYEVYQFQSGGRDYDKTTFPNITALLNHAELHGIDPNLFIGAARLVYDHLITLEGVKIRLVKKPLTDEGQGRNWDTAAFVVEWLEHNEAPG